MTSLRLSPVCRGSPLSGLESLFLHSNCRIKAKEFWKYCIMVLGSCLALMMELFKQSLLLSGCLGLKGHWMKSQWVMETVKFTHSTNAFRFGTLSFFKIVESVAKMEGIWSLQWFVHQGVYKSVQPIYNQQYKTVSKESSCGCCALFAYSDMWQVLFKNGEEYLYNINLTTLCKCRKWWRNSSDLPQTLWNVWIPIANSHTKDHKP